MKGGTRFRASWTLLQRGGLRPPFLTELGGHRPPLQLPRYARDDNKKRADRSARFALIPL